MNLTTEPQTVIWPEIYYVFIEKIGPFQSSAPEAWQTLHRSVPLILEKNQITGFTSLYKVGPLVYRAGVSLAAPPVDLPQGLQYEIFKGGKYAKFVLTGTYSNLPKASGRAFQSVNETKIQLRDDFCIENYVNNPATATEDKLITEILFPLAD